MYGQYGALAIADGALFFVLPASAQLTYYGNQL
jgi:hypothetical protein